MTATGTVCPKRPRRTPALRGGRAVCTGGKVGAKGREFSSGGPPQAIEAARLRRHVGWAGANGVPSPDGAKAGRPALRRGWGPRQAFRFVLALACAAAFCACAAAQGGGWAAVEGISPGSRVEARLSPPKAVNVKGMLVSVSGSAMDVQKSDGSIRHIARAQIAKIYLVGKSHKLRGGLIGAGIGSAGGVILGLTVYNGCCTDYYPGSQPHPVSKAAATVLYGAAIGAVGAVIGAIIGSHHSKTLVYRRASGRSPGDPTSGGQNAKSRADAVRLSPAAGAAADLR